MTEPGADRRLSYVRLGVARFAETVAFYRDVTGLALLAGSVQGGYAEFDVGSATRLSINDRRFLERAVSPPAADRGRDATVLVFQVPDVDAEAARLRAAGCRLLTEPRDRPLWGVRTAHVRDPDGNLVEVNRPLDRA
jgi:catechol 2,3-dioxygenase-like lactoylglutathione lyase family enzyme